MQHLEGSGTPVLYIGRTVLKRLMASNSQQHLRYSLITYHLLTPTISYYNIAYHIAPSNTDNKHNAVRVYHIPQLVNYNTYSVVTLLSYFLLYTNNTHTNVAVSHTHTLHTIGIFNHSDHLTYITYTIRL